MSPQRVMVKTWEITGKIISNTATFVGDSFCYVLGGMTRAARSVFSLVSVVILGIAELISTLFSLIFGVIAYVFEAVWSGLQAFGEAVGDFCSSFPWKGFALSLIYFAFMGYLISPWNKEFILFGILAIVLVLLIFIGGAINEHIESFVQILFVGAIFFVYIPVIGANIIQAELDLKLNLHFDKILLPGWFLLVCISEVYILLLPLVMNFKNSSKYEFKNLVLQLITVFLGLGIGWMIYQHFPIVESPAPLLEILKNWPNN
ncbi:MAG: hypothetical protein ACRCU2_08370 [Planktothrix sp.]